MLPPIDDAVLNNNPEFANLYKSLTGNILHPDGSTKNDMGAKKRDTVREELKLHRVKATKLHLLKNALATASPPSSQPQLSQQRRIKPGLSRQLASTDSGSQKQLPPELVDLLFLLPPFLEKAQTTPRLSLELLLSNPPFSDFPYLLPQLTPLISSQLITEATALARVLHPNTNPSFIHRSIPQVHPTTQAILSTIAASHAKLSQARLLTTSALVEHLNRHTDALVILLRTLETKHVPSAMSAELRATSFSLEAQLWAVSLQLLLWSFRGLIYPPEARAALSNYRRHLGAAKIRVGDSIRTREAELGDYGVFVTSNDGHVGCTGLGIGKADEAKERMMREMGRVWREMEGRLAEIKRDLERLDRS